MSLYDEIRCRPIEGISIDDRLRPPTPEGGILIDHLDEDDVDTGHNLPDSLAHLTSYWKPQAGDITILPQIFASKLTEQTNCQLFTEPENKRCRILGPKHALAKEMLQNIEPLLALLKAQQATNSVPANANILVLPPTAATPILQYPRVTAPHPAFQRIITHVHDHASLPTKALGEVRQYDHQGKCVTPDNLLAIGISPTNAIRPSMVWDGHIYQTFGDSANLQPRASKPTLNAISSTRILHNQTQDRIATWTDEVVMGADPDIPPATPKEPVVSTRRRIAVEPESDSDTEPESDIKTKIPTTIPQPQAQQISSPCLLLSPSSPPTSSIHLSPALLEATNIVSSLPAPTTSHLLDLQAEVGFEIPADFGLSSITTARPNPFIPPLDPPLDQIKFGTTSKQDNRSANQSAPTLISLSPESPKALSVSRRGGSAFRRGQRAPRGPVSYATASSHAHDQLSADNDLLTGFVSPPPRGGRGRGGRARGGSSRQGFSSRHQTPSERDATLADRSKARPSQSFRQRSDDYPTSYPAVAPGFENCDDTLLSDPATQINSTRGSTTRPRNASVQSGTGSSGGNSATSNGARAIRFSDRGADYTQTSLPHKNIHLLREQRLRELQGNENKKAPDTPPPTLRSTMNQQGRNPRKRSGRGGSNSSQSTPAPKNTTANNEPSERSRDHTPSKFPKNTGEAGMSAAKLAQIRKNPLLAKLHADTLEESMREEQCRKLIPQLEKLFEISRAFNGELSFQAQLGQVLVTYGSMVSAEKFVDPAMWSKMFEPQQSSNSMVQSSFTPILTTNGADIDRALEMKMPDGKGKGKIKAFVAKPISGSVSYHFSCQSRNNDEFSIVVDQTGKYELRREPVTTGMVNVHCPSHIWDTAFVLSGHLQWLNPPPALQKSISAFVQSIYVLPDREKLMMVFRQPSDHEMEIRDLMVKRTSKHGCNMPKCNKLQLQITETKTLLFKKNHEDTNLWQAYESVTDDHQRLMDTGRVHYEISVIHTDINEALAQNAQLEFGHLTDEETTGKSLVKSQRSSIYSMLDMALCMVSKLDFMGLSNIGTQQRKAAEEAAQRLKLTQAAESQAKPTVPGSMPVQSRFSSSLVRDGNGLATVTEVPGIRANTLAEVYSNPDGSRYKLGLGGAKIPVSTNQDIPSTGDAVLPDDSMSQVGRPPQSFLQAMRPRRPGVSATSSVGTTIAPARQFYSVNNQSAGSREANYW